MTDISSLSDQARTLIADAYDGGVADGREERLNDTDYRRKVALIVLAEQLEQAALWLKVDAAAAGLLTTCATGLRGLARQPSPHPPAAMEPPPDSPMVDVSSG